MSETQTKEVLVSQLPVALPRGTEEGCRVFACPCCSNMIRVSDWDNTGAAKICPSCQKQILIP